MDRILNEEADLLGNAILASGKEPSYQSIAALLPPVLQGGAEDASDFYLCGLRSQEQRVAETEPYIQLVLLCIY